MGHPDLANTSLRLSPQVSLDCVKLTANPNHHTPQILRTFGMAGTGLGESGGRLGSLQMPQGPVNPEKAARVGNRRN